VVFFQGSSGTVNNCTLDGNARDGVAIESASATVINSSMSNNGRLGVIVTDGGSGRIGVDNANLAGPNKINSNKSNGVQVTIGGTAFIGANDIIGNGTDPNAPTGRFGIFIVNATADIIGANNIKNNANHGVFARNASILIGDTSGSFNTFSGVNTISGNGTAVNNSAGVFGFVGTAMVVRNAAITGNNGFGLFLSLRSSAQISGNMIQNNIGTVPTSGDGIRLALGSALFVDVVPPAIANVLTGNAGWGLNCTDNESSVANAGSLVVIPPPQP